MCSSDLIEKKERTFPVGEAGFVNPRITTGFTFLPRTHSRAQWFGPTRPQKAKMLRVGYGPVADLQAKLLMNNNVTGVTGL